MKLAASWDRKIGTLKRLISAISMAYDFVSPEEIYFVSRK
jgi:hypothetical protein